MKIRCVILRRNRTQHVKKVDQRRGFFRFNRGIYLLRKEDINLTYKLSSLPHVNPTPELLFFEGDPIPVSHVHDEGRAGKFLDSIVISNALEEIGQPRGIFFEVIGDYLRNPFKIIFLVFAVVIGIGLIQSLFRG